MIITVDVDLEHLAEVMFVRFLHNKITHSVIYSLEECHYVYPLLKLCFNSLRMECLHKLFEIYEDLSLSSHLFIYPVIHLYRYGFMDIHFIHQFIINFILVLLLKLIQFLPLGCSVGFSVSLTYPHHCLFFFSTSLYAGLTKFFRFILYFHVLTHFFFQLRVINSHVFSQIFILCIIKNISEEHFL